MLQYCGRQINQINLKVPQNFYRVDVEATGRINAEQLFELFDRLGLPISTDDAILLIRKINGGEEGLPVLDLEIYNGFEP